MQSDSPILPLPNRRLPFVEEDGGGGFAICDAVGARDWRIEYVRCIFAVGVAWIGADWGAELRRIK